MVGFLVGFFVGDFEIGPEVGKTVGEAVTGVKVGTFVGVVVVGVAVVGTLVGSFVVGENVGFVGASVTNTFGAEDGLTVLETHFFFWTLQYAPSLTAFLHFLPLYPQKDFS